MKNELQYPDDLELTSENIFFIKKFSKDQLCLSKLAQYMYDEGQGKQFDELYKMAFGKDSTDPLAHENIGLLRNMEFKGYYFGLRRSIGYDENGKPRGVWLSQPFLIKRDSRHYDYLFTFMFLDIGRKEDFLQYHLMHSFDNVKLKYRIFLKKIKDDIEASNKPVSFLSQWIKDNLKKKSEVFDNSFHDVDTEEAKFFKSSFKSVEKYGFVINELAKKELGAWFDSKGNYVRKGRGNDHQSAVLTLLRVLIEGKFLKEESWTKANKVDFAKKAFAVKVGENTSNHSGSDKHYSQLKIILPWNQKMKKS